MLRKVIFACFILWATELFAQDVVRIGPYEEKYEPGVVLVKFEEEVNIPLTKERRLGKVVITGIQKALSKYGIEQGERLFPQAKRGKKFGKVLGYSGEEIEVGSLYNIFKLEFDPKHDAKTVAGELARQEGVVYAEPDYYFYALRAVPDRAHTDLRTSGFAKSTDTIPNDPLYGDQWYLAAVNAPAAWDSTTGDTTQVIGIIDTGVDWDHADLDDNIWRNWDEIPNNGLDDDGNGFVDDIRGWDFVNDDNNPNDDNSHGTHVAGIAAAEGNNGVGICGVAWNAKIMPVKMLQSSGQGSSSDLASAINYAADNGATVINMSLGSYAESQTVKIALENAYAYAVLVAAAGNDAKKLVQEGMPAGNMFPGCYSFVIGVEATTNSGSRAGFSNIDPSGPVEYWNQWGHNYEMKAPGVSIYSTFLNGTYRYLNGTSMASPVVAGAVALLNVYNPAQSKEQLFARLIQGANNGILDIRNSLDELVPDLYYITYTLIDTLPGCDNDGIADAGETIELYFTVKNAGGLADSVWSKLRFGEFEDSTTANILDSTSYIGDISAYAALTGELDPFIIEIDPSVVNNRDIAFEYEIGASNHSSFIEDLIINVQRGEELIGVLDSVLVLTPENYWLVTQSFRVGINGKLIIKPGTLIDITEGNYIDLRGQVIAKGKMDSLISITSTRGPASGFVRSYYSSVLDTFIYCSFENIGNPLHNLLGADNSFIVDHCTFTDIYLDPNLYQQGLFVGVKELTNSIISDFWGTDAVFATYGLTLLERNNIYNTLNWFLGNSLDGISVKFNNFVKNTFDTTHPNPCTEASCIFYISANSEDFLNNNFISNTHILGTEGSVDIINLPNQYWGSSIISNVQDNYYDFWDYASIPLLDTEPILTQPSDSAHGIVWKVELNGTDPQDEQLDPIGSETVEFDVYFNRAMDITYTPFLTFGVREPYTQNIVKDNASWSADSTVWTAYYTIGLETGDGITTIRVADARDTDSFEIPIENTRFRFVIQAAGAASIQFIATARVGKVELEWPGAPTDDALGYNMYRLYNLTDSTFSDTLRINTTLITDTTYTDFDVIPDTTYHYMYKVLGTDMAESDYSKSVAATPVSASSGDANGDMAVNVLDIVAIVNYILEENPQPFLLDAADVNGDGSINVLDIVGVVNLILGVPKPALAAHSPGEISSGEAGLMVSDQTIQLCTSAAVAGLQFALIGQDIEHIHLKPTSGLDGMEIGSAVNDGNATYVIYSLTGKCLPPGKRTLFTIEGGKDVKIKQVMCCDARGRAIRIRVKSKDLVETPLIYSLSQNYPNPFNAVTAIRYGLPKAEEVQLTVFNVLGQRVKTFKEGKKEAGYHRVIWNGRNESGVPVASGLYLYRLEAGDFVRCGKMVLLR